MTTTPTPPHATELDIAQVVGPNVLAPVLWASIPGTGVLEAVSLPAGWSITAAKPYTLAVTPGPNFAAAETPAGTIDGVNTAFTLANTPNPPASLQLFRNGLLQVEGGDYTLAGNAISGFALTVGDQPIAYYRF